MLGLCPLQLVIIVACQGEDKCVVEFALRVAAVVSQFGLVHKPEAARYVCTPGIGSIALNTHSLGCERKECQLAQQRDGLRYIAMTLCRNSNPVPDRHRRYARI